MIHRDLKPSNVIMTKVGGRIVPKLADFGIAKVLAERKKRTGTGTKMGTLWYMAPEQFQSAKNVDHRAELYSLGVMLFEMLTGRLPFDGDTEWEVMKGHLETPPPPVRSVVPGIPELTGGEDGAGGLEAIPVPDMGWHGTPEDAPATKDNRVTFWIHPDRPIRGTLRAARAEDERFVLIVRRTPSAGDVAPCNDARVCDAFDNPLGVYVQRFTPYDTCPRRTCSGDYGFCESSCSCALAYMCPIGSIYLDCECCLSYSCFPLPCYCTYCAPMDDVFSTYCPGG